MQNPDASVPAVPPVPPGPAAPLVTLDDPARMNVLGLFLAAALRRNFKGGSLRGAMTVDADGMRATVRFEEGRATVTRDEKDRRVLISGSLGLLTEALVHRRLLTLLKVKVEGNRLFALRALGVLRS